MPKIDTIRLNCLNPASQAQFYCDTLGMTDFGDNRVGYGGNQASLSFIQADLEAPYEPQKNDLFWKIALAVPNIELAYKQLTENGVQVSTPNQFQDVGYLAKFIDPEGFIVELIDHWFKGCRPSVPIDQNLLGGGAHLNLLTLRSAHIEQIKEVCDAWGMTPLSIQRVENYGFTLHFFAFTEESPPSQDLHAIENREWVYQREYTVLEVQHLLDDIPIVQPTEGAVGYAGTVFSGSPTNKNQESVYSTAYLLNSTV